MLARGYNGTVLCHSTQVLPGHFAQRFETRIGGELRQMNAPQVLVLIDEEFEASVSAASLKEAAFATLRACGQTSRAISIQVVDDAIVQNHNRIYRGQDAPTDVLSFAIQEGPSLQAEPPEDLAAELATDLGDLLLAFPYAARQARRFGHSLAAELQLLVVHGTLHLLGFDHDSEDGRAAMWRKQTQVLAGLTCEDLSSRITAQD